MDAYEQSLIDEVLYLHSLWHQGPPRNTNPNPVPTRIPIPIPIPTPYPSSSIHPQPCDSTNILWRYPPPPVNLNPNPNRNPSRHLQPCNPTNFKHNGKRIRGGRGGKGNKIHSESDPPPASDVAWPCTVPAETPQATTSGWPDLKREATRLPSSEEQAHFAAKQVQQKGLKVAREFLASSADSDGDSDEGIEDDDEVLADGGCEEYAFFLKVFTEDHELRTYYEKSWNSGDFSCLVCGGIGRKLGKRFKNCVALVQHSIAIARTKKKRAHRAYGRAICRVLGWDINRLPSIVLSLDDPLGRSLAKTCQSQDCGEKLQGNVDGGMEPSDMPGEASNLPETGQLLNGNDVGTSNVVANDLMVEKEHFEADDIGNITKNKPMDFIVYDGQKEIMKIRIDNEVAEVVAIESKDPRDCMVR